MFLSSKTRSERKTRLQTELKARDVSEGIDKELFQRRKGSRDRQELKILLLGQAEAGKSTLMKQFQLLYEPQSLEKERASWRMVVYLNIIRSIQHILITVANKSRSHHSLHHDEPEISASSGILLHVAGADSDTTLNGSPSLAPASPSLATDSPAIYPIEYLRLRLSPLVAMQEQLARCLNGEVTSAGSGLGSISVCGGWQTRPAENGSYVEGGRSEGRLHQENGVDELLDDIARILDTCKYELKVLLDHPRVKSLIAKRSLRLDESIGYFLNHISRISAEGYCPTNDDILHARIQTIGVSEHRFNINHHEKAMIWHIYDVGGVRGQFQSWVPYFEDATAVIFLAPISAFDQYLDDDSRTNRLRNSLCMFQQICSNPLLKHCTIILLLNKTDILHRKLAQGREVHKYISSFGTRPNDAETVMAYFRQQFLQVHKLNYVHRRLLYSHFTSVVNTAATHRTIVNLIHSELAIAHIKVEVYNSSSNYYERSSPSPANKSLLVSLATDLLKALADPSPKFHNLLSPLLPLLSSITPFEPSHHTSAKHHQDYAAENATKLSAIAHDIHERLSHTPLVFLIVDTGNKRWADSSANLGMEHTVIIEKRLMEVLALQTPEARLFSFLVVYHEFGYLFEQWHNQHRRYGDFRRKEIEPLDSLMQRRIVWGHAGAFIEWASMGGVSHWDDKGLSLHVAPQQIRRITSEQAQQ